MASNRDYLTTSELEEYADITVTDADEADDQISQAEELIDSYVGFQEKFIPGEYRGIITAVSNSNKTFADTTNYSNLGANDNYFKGCWVEIIGGTGAGQRAKIDSSNKTNKTITLGAALTTTPNTTSVFRIYQLGKFPRIRDVYVEPTNQTYYKSIPESVRRATAAQVEYIINMGSKFFSTDKSAMQSESIGNYSYTKKGGPGTSNIDLIAPKARTLLKGLQNSTGRLAGDNPTWL